MPRLFLALPIPEELQKLLGRLSLPDGPGIRRIHRSQLHLTLHFLGESDPAFILAATSTTRTPSFSLQLTQPGLFGRPASGGVLWVGPADPAPIRVAHEEFARSLTSAGVKLESRPFVPHVTLARFSRGTRRSLVTKFLDQALPPLPAWHADCVVLYSSHPVPGGVRYREEGVIPLVS